jgi:hypothetical protein
VRIVEKLRADALHGDIRAQALYYARVRAVLLPDDGPETEPPLPPEVAAAMIHAGLLAASPPPPPKAQRPKPRRVHEPGDRV